jgi:hypothetical protein
MQGKKGKQDLEGAFKDLLVQLFHDDMSKRVKRFLSIPLI